MTYSDVRQARKSSNLWLWLLVLWLSIMLLLSIMEIEIVYTIITGTLGLIAFVWHVFSQGYRWYRNRNPWELTFQVMQPQDVEQRDTSHGRLEIKPGSYTIQVELIAKVPTTLSSQATIATAMKPVSRWDTIRSQIKRKQFILSPQNIISGIKLLLGQSFFVNPPPNCPVQIKKVEDKTPGREEYGSIFTPKLGSQPGSGTSMWWLHYNPPFEIGAGSCIVLNLEIEASATWKGYIGFSSQIEGQIRRIYRKVEVSSR